MIILWSSWNIPKEKSKVVWVEINGQSHMKIDDVILFKLFPSLKMVVGPKDVQMGSIYIYT